MVLQVEISSRVGLRGPWWPWTTSGKTESARGPWGRLGSGLFLWRLRAEEMVLYIRTADEQQAALWLCLVALWYALQW